MACPPGKISRNSYRRKPYVRSNGTKVAGAFVPETCVPDKGKPGKTPQSRKVLPKIGKELSLRKFGYATHESNSDRHEALRAAADSTNNPLLVLRHLNLIRNYQADPTAKKIMDEDVAYMSNYYKNNYPVARQKSRKSRKGSRRSRRKSKK